MPDSPRPSVSNAKRCACNPMQPHATWCNATQPGATSERVWQNEPNFHSRSPSTRSHQRRAQPRHRIGCRLDRAGGAGRVQRGATGCDATQPHKTESRHAQNEPNPSPGGLRHFRLRRAQSSRGKLPCARPPYPSPPARAGRPSHGKRPSRVQRHATACNPTQRHATKTRRVQNEPISARRSFRRPPTRGRPAARDGSLHAGCRARAERRPLDRLALAARAGVPRGTPPDPRANDRGVRAAVGAESAEGGGNRKRTAREDEPGG